MAGSNRTQADSGLVDEQTPTLQDASSLTTKYSGYKIPNRVILQAPSGSSSFFPEEPPDSTAASETSPQNFQETRILSSREVRQRADQALREAEQRRKLLREEEARSLMEDE